MGELLLQLSVLYMVPGSGLGGVFIQLSLSWHRMWLWREQVLESDTSGEDSSLHHFCIVVGSM